MQTSKAKTKTGSSEGPPQRTSPVNPRSSRVSKSADSDCNSVSSATPTKTSTGKLSPKVIERRSPRSPVTEKKRPSRLSELENQISQLQEELKKTKDQLNASEEWKKQAQQEAEETKKQFLALSEKLDDSQRQLVEFSAAEEDRLQELRKISQERDRAWQSELEAIEKQHSVDSAALSSAMNEIQKLKSQLEMVLKSDAAHLKQYEDACTELQALGQEMADALATIENLKIELKDCQRSEAEVHMKLAEAQERLEMAKSTIETLNMEGLGLRESLSYKLSELEESKARVSALEEGFKILNANKIVEESDQSEIKEINKISSLEKEVKQLRAALEAAETKYQEERVHSTMKMQAAYESIDRRDSLGKEAELELALNNAKSEILKLKANLVDKEAELQRIADMNQKKSADKEIAEGNHMQAELHSELMKLNADITEFKANLMDKETELQNVLEENETLKSELGRKEMETRKSYDEAIAELELAKAAEQDALLRLGHVTEEADKSSRRAARTAEQLEAAQAVNSETEAELKRLRIQSDQWRKAAEAAAAVLTTGNNTGGRLMERTGSLDSDFNTVAGKMLSSPFSDDLDYESPKKKNNNMLRKIGGLWKKSPK